MNILHLNTRALGSGNKDSVIKNLVSKYKLQMVGLTETKLRGVDVNGIHLLWGRSSVKFVFFDASQSRGGGVIRVWKIEKFDCVSCDKSDRWIMVHGFIYYDRWIIVVRIQRVDH